LKASVGQSRAGQSTREDLGHSFALWRIWLMIGANTVFKQYRRSAIGPFWIPISLAVALIAFGFVYSWALKLPINEYIPYLAVGFTVWLMISAFVVDGCTAYTAYEFYLRNAPLPLALFPLATVTRILVMFLHNIVVVVPFLIYFGYYPGTSWLLGLAGLLLTILNGPWIVMLLGMLCARFRDLPQIVAVVMQIAFFLTPIMWVADNPTEPIRLILALNPLHPFVEISRAPFLGQPVAGVVWLKAIGLTVFGNALALAVFEGYRKRIPYWL
jgi:ABC-type polysaccharide/polyol phosphate export permease